MSGTFWVKKKRRVTYFDLEQQQYLANMIDVVDVAEIRLEISKNLLIIVGSRRMAQRCITFLWGYSLDTLLLHTFPLAHGLLAVNDHLVGIMDNPVADGVSQDRIANLFSPSGYRELRAEDRRSILVSGFCNLKQIPCLCFLQRIQQPFVENQQRAFFILLDHLPEGAIGSCNGEFCQKFR